MKKYLLLVLLCSSTFAFASNEVVINGKKYDCRDQIVVKKGSITCKNKVLDVLPKDWWVSAEETVCGTEQVEKHENGGGMKSVRASVHKSAFIDKASVVCGTSKIGKPVKLMGTTHVKGDVEIAGSSTVTDSKVSGASEILSSEVTNSNIYGSSTARVSKIIDSELSGAAKSIDSEITNNSVLRGAIEVRGSKLKETRVEGTAYITDDSDIEKSSFIGSVKVQYGKIKQCSFRGAARILRQSCTNDELMF